MPTPRLEALRVYTRKLLETRGKVGDSDLKAFFAAGFTRRQAMEVPLGIAFKTLSNFSHHLQPVPLDDAVEPFRWTPVSGTAGRKILVTGWLRSDGREALEQYQAGAGPIMGKHGGRPLLKSRPEEYPVGQGPNMVVLMDFPSAEAVKAAFDDQAYRKLIPLRERAFSRLEVTDLGADAPGA